MIKQPRKVPRFVTSQYGLHQMKNGPTHVLENSSSCIDLIFTSEPNLVVDSGVHPSSHPNCHYQIVYAKFNLKIHFPLPYEREIWHYGQGNTEFIRRAVHKFNWQRAFTNRNINERVYFFNKTILNIVSNFVPHETICDDRDPHWINNQIKNLINDKKILYKKYLRSGKNTKLFKEFKLLQNKIVNLANDSRDRYFIRIYNKLNNPHVSPKVY